MLRAVYQHGAHEDAEEGGSLCRLIEGSKPKGDLRPNTCKPPYMYDLYYKACTVSHRAGHVIYESARIP